MKKVQNFKTSPVNMQTPTGQSNETFLNLASQELESQADVLVPGCRVDSEISRFYCGWKLVCNHRFFVVISRKQLFMFLRQIKQERFKGLI